LCLLYADTELTEKVHEACYEQYVKSSARAIGSTENADACYEYAGERGSDGCNVLLLLLLYGTDIGTPFFQQASARISYL
jgi:hypothetical protein